MRKVPPQIPIQVTPKPSVSTSGPPETWGWPARTRTAASGQTSPTGRAPGKSMAAARVAKSPRTSASAWKRRASLASGSAAGSAPSPGPPPRGARGRRIGGWLGESRGLRSRPSPARGRGRDRRLVSRGAGRRELVVREADPLGQVGDSPLPVRGDQHPVRGAAVEQADGELARPRIVPVCGDDGQAAPRPARRAGADREGAGAARQEHCPLPERLGIWGGLPFPGVGGVERTQDRQGTEPPGAAEPGAAGLVDLEDPRKEAGVRKNGGAVVRHEQPLQAPAGAGQRESRQRGERKVMAQPRAQPKLVVRGAIAQTQGAQPVADRNREPLPGPGGALATARLPAFECAADQRPVALAADPGQCLGRAPRVPPKQEARPARSRCAPGSRRRPRGAAPGRRRAAAPRTRAPA